MFLKLGEKSLADHATGFAALELGPTQVWPFHQPLSPIADPLLVGTRFQDSYLVHPPALAAILRRAAVGPVNAHGWGGKKVRDLAVWDLPEMRLLTLRALLMFCQARSVLSAHVIDRWANVVEHGDYSTPHSHYDADGAVVYFMDSGVPIGVPADAVTVEGRFQLLDPRIPFCCPNRPGRPTRGIMPDMEPGLMILFPAEFLHFVKPYYGRRPRVTLAWNVVAGEPDHEIDLTQPVAGVAARITHE